MFNNMQKTGILIHPFSAFTCVSSACRQFIVGIIIYLVCGGNVFAQQVKIPKGMLDIGVARIDITPETPIRLAGMGLRTKAESDGVLQRLNAKALAIGTDAQGPCILITVDLIGIPGHVTDEIAKRLAKKTGLDRSRLVICASHTHSGPELGTLINILQYRTATAFSDSLLPVNQLIHINRYVAQLQDKLEQVALAALQARKPSFAAWGKGEVNFAQNRRLLNGPVDHSMPLLRIIGADGNIRAILVNYACHAVVFGGESNKINGDWVGEAQRLIEEKYPGAIAMMAMGCGADANPARDTMKNIAPSVQVGIFGKMIADEAGRVLTTRLQPVTVQPKARFKQIQLAFAHIPNAEELISRTKDVTVKGYYARLALERITRGETLPANITYPVQTWVFGKQLTMIFLGGEVVADYSIRLKQELGDHVWINSYSNDVPCYIPSYRALKNPRYRYEVESSMYYYNKPAPFADDVEERIITAVHSLLPR